MSLEFFFFLSELLMQLFGATMHLNLLKLAEYAAGERDISVFGEGSELIFILEIDKDWVRSCEMENII